MESSMILYSDSIVWPVSTKLAHLFKEIANVNDHTRTVYAGM